MRRLIAIVSVIVGIFAWSAAALAYVQSGGAIEQEASEIEKLLRCPVCTGQTLAESHVEKAQEIKQEIRKMLAEGKTRQQILDYYAAQYGEWILTQPRSKVVWAMPAVILAVGAVVVFAFLRRAGGRPGRGLSPEGGPGGGSPNGGSGAGGTGPSRGGPDRAPGLPPGLEPGPAGGALAAAAEGTEPLGLDPRVQEKIRQRLQDFI